MRASHIALIAAVLAIPSVGYAQQDNGPVGGPVQPDGSSLGPSPEQPRPSLGSPSGSTLEEARSRAPRAPSRPARSFGVSLSWAGCREMYPSRRERSEWAPLSSTVSACWLI